MWFEQIVRKETGCAAYMVGSLTSGECVVFDPLWDIQPYLDAAKKQSSKIQYVIDSHSHADHVSGARRLAKLTGATLLMPDKAEIAYEAERISGGDTLQMGEVKLDIVVLRLGYLPHVILSR